MSRAQTSAEEARFIARLRARDERAFNELVRLYERRIYALVFRMLGRRDEAEDLVQEVFVQVFKAIDQFRGEAKFSTWLYRIAINLCKNRAKYLQRRHAGKQDDIDDMADRSQLGGGTGVTTGGVARPDEAFAGMETEQMIRICLTRMDPDFREVLILRDIEGMSYEEIGQISGLAAGTVKSRLFRARSQLKKLVEAAMGEAIQ